MWKNKGISLIVLVITIIVMIILAGAVIMALNGSGIIDNTDKARKDNDLAVTKQALVVAFSNWTLDNEGKKLESVEELLPYIDKSVDIDKYNVVIKNGVPTIVIQDNYGEETYPKVGEVVIPTGFYHVGGTKDTGLVISDSSEDEGAGDSHAVAGGLKGNQFVWVPVENYNDFVRVNYETQLREFSNQPTIEDKPYEIQPTEGGNKEVDKMHASVKKYKGFFVARYEMGIAEGMERPLSNTANTYATGEYIPRSKKDIWVWCYIPWSNSTAISEYDGAAGDDTANGAVKVARSMYKDDASNTKAVVSTMIYGVQWDAVMRWLKDSQIDLKNTRSWGNYNDGTIPSPGHQMTGNQDAWKQKNIYDMAGNMWEWTMEGTANSYRIIRGGDRSTGGSVHPVIFRSPNRPDLAYEGATTRVALYVK
ncbi:MAG: hypothetical protein PHR25_04345 [Clostridia bacterium]|nr:hypothetical protein [Clostridia bacterium]MDD4375993.1 hypothetical protein [Clostridia bacterium]